MSVKAHKVCKKKKPVKTFQTTQYIEDMLLILGNDSSEKILQVYDL